MVFPICIYYLPRRYFTTKTSFHSYGSHSEVSTRSTKMRLPDTLPESAKQGNKDGLEWLHGNMIFRLPVFTDHFVERS